MKLYLWTIERTDNWGYDEYSDAVVVAKTEQDARTIHPDGEERDWEWTSSWPVKPEELKVTKVGTAVPELKAGAVLCASFHAG